MEDTTETEPVVLIGIKRSRVSKPVRRVFCYIEPIQVRIGVRGGKLDTVREPLVDLQQQRLVSFAAAALKYGYRSVRALRGKTDRFCTDTLADLRTAARRGSIEQVQVFQEQ